MDFDQYEPAPRGSASPLPAAPDSSPPPAPAKPRPPVPVVVGGPTRPLTVPLTYPLGYAGRTYTAITLRRPTSVEVGRFFERLVDGESEGRDDDGLLYFPVFYLPGDPEIEVPAVVISALDDDDRTVVMERLTDFLPRRLLALVAARQPGSGEDTGDDTAPTSST